MSLETVIAAEKLIFSFANSNILVYFKQLF